MGFRRQVLNHNMDPARRTHGLSRGFHEELPGLWELEFRAVEAWTTALRYPALSTKGREIEILRLLEEEPHGRFVPPGPAPQAKVRLIGSRGPNIGEEISIEARHRLHLHPADPFEIPQLP